MADFLENKRVNITKNMDSYENKYYNMGYKFIAGVDECGRGCLAGPVAAAAVILPVGCELRGVDDSKLLTEARRERAFDLIMQKALFIRFATIDAVEIDRINILKASLKAMGRAIDDLPLKPEIVLIDGPFQPDINKEGKIFETIIKGDTKSISIAAASIVAKVMRDRLMRLYHGDYPCYGFNKHKGYGTKAHYAAIAKNGICPLHRRSFRLYKNDAKQ